MKLTRLLGKTAPRGGWLTPPAARRKDALNELLTRYGHRRVWLRLRDDIDEIGPRRKRRLFQRFLDAADAHPKSMIRIPIWNGGERGRGEHVTRELTEYALFPTEEPFAVEIRTALLLLNRDPYRWLFEECEEAAAAEGEPEPDDEELTPAPPPPKRGRRTPKKKP